MRRLFILLFILVFGSLFPQSKQEKKNDVVAPQEQVVSQDNRAAELERAKQEIKEAYTIIGEYTIHIQKLQESNQQLGQWLEEMRRVLKELANAETIEERDEILKKYQLKQQ